MKIDDDNIIAIQLIIIVTLAVFCVFSFGLRNDAQQCNSSILKFCWLGCWCWNKFAQWLHTFWLFMPLSESSLSLPCTVFMSWIKFWQSLTTIYSHFCLTTAHTSVVCSGRLCHLPTPWLTVSDLVLKFWFKNSVMMNLSALCQTPSALGWSVWNC